MKLTPALMAEEEGIERAGQLVRGYFGMDAHHVQFNVITAKTLRKAQADFQVAVVD